MNQYYLDSPINQDIYKQNFNVNDYLLYNSKDYYSWIKDNLNDYSFEFDYKNKSFEEICENKEYSLKPQQKFAGRIFNTFTKNNGLLVYHGLGSGKTQTSIIISEAFKFRNTKGDTIIQGRSDSVVLIVVPGALVDQYYSEILGNIENGEIKSASSQVVINGERQFYLNKKLRIAINENLNSIKELQKKIKEGSGNIQKLKSQIAELEVENRDRYELERRKINKVYEIISHEKFLNRLFKITDSNFIEGEYIHLLQKPNGLLIIDEAHGLVSAFGSSYRKLLIAMRYYAHPKFKIVLLTGSPIYDKPFEFGLLINLLRPRIPFPDGFEKFNEIFLENKNLKNKELFKQMCSGYISYFKGGNPEAYPYKKTILMNHSMESYQYSSYKKALFKEIERDKKNEVASKEDFLVQINTDQKVGDEISTSVFNNSRLFCNIAFPEVNRTGVSRQKLVELGLTEFKKVLRSSSDVLKTVRGYSSKFAKVAELIAQSEGPVFVYSNYVYYGVEAMASVLNALGYAEYPAKGEKGSYFVWKGQADPDDVKRAYHAFNNPKNKEGKNLKVMFGTQSVMEGVDFKRVRQIHVLDPWWNDSRMQQVIARGIRLCSHRELESEQRLVDVFIHLSSLGSGNVVYQLVYRKELDDKTIEQKCYSTLERINNLERNPSKWIFYEAFINQGGEIINTKTQFKTHQIVSGSIKKLGDAELNKQFGKWKNMDTISVEEYMYNRSLSKLNTNRQFEKAIKESSLDCEINKNGNIIRLEEHYLPDARSDTFKLVYLNYSTGEMYSRLNVKSEFEDLGESFLTLKDIFANVAKNSNSFDFKDLSTGEVVTFPKNLIISENTDCSTVNYSFEKVPSKIVDLTINKELISKLKKMSLQQLKQFFFDVEHKNIITDDPKLGNEIKKFGSKQSLSEKQELINKLTNIGIGIDENIWDFYTLDQLKKIASKILI